MPIVDYEQRLSSRFQCPTPKDASPADKRAHQLAKVYDVKSPHVKVDCIIGTRGAFVERTDCNYYKGHVPDAPVLLGAPQLEVYRRGEIECGWSKKRVVATVVAASVGALIGVAGCAGLVGFAAMLHAIWPAVYAAVTFSQVAWLFIPWALAGALLTTLSDWRDWSDARATFQGMRKMAEVATKLDAGVRRDEEDRLSATLVNEGRQSGSWLLLQGSLELEAARERAALPVVTDKPVAA